MKNDRVYVQFKNVPEKGGYPQDRRPTKFGPPDGAKSRFRPVAFTDLEQQIVYVHWNCVEKELALEILETKDLDAYRWIAYIEQKSHDLDKSPFIDMDSNGGSLFLQDEADHELAEIRFQWLTLTDHSCLAHSKDGAGLVHRLCLGYQFCQVIFPRNEEVTNPDDDAVVDKEWKSD